MYNTRIRMFAMSDLHRYISDNLIIYIIIYYNHIELYRYVVAVL